MLSHTVNVSTCSLVAVGRFSITRDDSSKQQNYLYIRMEHKSDVRLHVLLIFTLYFHYTFYLHVYIIKGEEDELFFLTQIAFCLKFSFLTEDTLKYFINAYFGMTCYTILHLRRHNLIYFCIVLKC